MALYQDSTSYVSTNSLSNQYTPVVDYRDGGFQSIPTGSLLRLSVAPRTEKYFSTAPSFQSRLDNARIAAPDTVPVVLDDSGMTAPSSSAMLAPEGNKINASGDYFTLGNSYRLHQN